MCFFFCNSIPCSSCSALHGVNPNFLKKICFFRATCREKGSKYAKSWARTLKPSILHSAFNEVSFISKNHMRVELYLFYGIWIILCNWIVLWYYNNLEKLPPNVLISIDLSILIFSTCRAFNYYSITGSVNYSGHVGLEILENNKLKSYLGNSEIDCVPISWNFLKEKINVAKSFFFKRNFKIYISIKRCNEWVLWSFKYEVEYMAWHSQ